VNRLPSTRQTGQQGEALARQYLVRLGYEIQHCNWRHHRDELDIVALWPFPPTLVFAEVKSLRRTGIFHPEDAVDAPKRARMARTAQAYIEQHNLGHLPARFDVLTVALDDPEHPRIVHYPDAFDAPR
jgi:putative endonuclease